MSPHTIETKDILKGGPVESVIASSGGTFSKKKQFSVVADLESGMVSFKVEVAGKSSNFAHANIHEAVEAYNES